MKNKFVQSLLVVMSFAAIGTATILTACGKMQCSDTDVSYSDIEYDADFKPYAGVFCDLYSITGDIIIVANNQDVVKSALDNDETDDYGNDDTESDDLYIIDWSQVPYIEYNVPDNAGFKSYMPYDAITDKSSDQYYLQHYLAYTGDYGIRMYDGRYCVALGNAFNVAVGDYGELILANGEVMPIIVADIKDDADTDNVNMFTKANGCVSEFIVDTNALDDYARKTGDLSVVNESWDSPVRMVRIYDNNIFCGGEV